MPLGLEDIKTFKSSIRLSSLPTIVGILIFISRINGSYESLKASTIFIYQHFSFSTCSVEFEHEQTRFIISGSR